MSSSRLLIAALAGSVLAGCVTVADPDETTRNADGEVVQGGAVSVLRISLGDCLEPVEEGLIDSVDAVPCEGPHQSEVYHSFEIPDGPFPGMTEVQRQSDEGCYDAFLEFIGVPYEDSVYGYSVIEPTEESWVPFKPNEVLCLVGMYDGTSKTGTARGAGV